MSGLVARNLHGYSPIVMRISDPRGLPEARCKSLGAQEYSIPWQAWCSGAFGFKRVASGQHSLLLRV